MTITAPEGRIVAIRLEGSQLRVFGDGFGIYGTPFPPRDVLASVEVVAQTEVKTDKGLFTWTAIGAIAAGPAGALAGALLSGGKDTEVTFVARFYDGRSVVSSANIDTFRTLYSAAAAAPSVPGGMPVVPGPRPGERGLRIAMALGAVFLLYGCSAVCAVAHACSSATDRIMDASARVPMSPADVGPAE